jgi:hypothetical protein
LIGSVEAIANTPAYRGLAVAVFENLELADYGNRIPFLTFEISADEETPTIGAILADASNALIASDAGQEIVGYAAYGQSVRLAIEPLIESYAVKLFDDGSQLRPPNGSALSVSEDDWGNSPNNDQVARIQRDQLPTRTLPGSLRLGFYDPARDFQTGEARASAGEQQASELKRELPAAISASDAKSLVQQMLATEWARRDRLTLRLPPRYLGLEPGNRLEILLNSGRWCVEKCTIDGLVVVAELLHAGAPTSVILADSGRITANPDTAAGVLSVALINVGGVLQQSSTDPTLLLAASAPNPGWKRRSVQVTIPGQTVVTQSAGRKSVLGRALTILAPGEPYLIDTINSVDIELIDASQWLTSCDDDALSAGTNLAVVGSELIQFGQASPLAQGHFRLSRLLRGRGGTEWARSNHTADDVFCVIEPGTVQPLALPASSIGALVTASAQGGPSASMLVSVDPLRPPSPVNLAAAIQSTGDLAVNWTRRSRAGFVWNDEVDAPLGERIEQYRVTITSSADAAEFLADQPSLSVPAADLAGFGAGPVTIEVRQVGDLAVSRPVQIGITLP